MCMSITPLHTQALRLTTMPTLVVVLVLSFLMICCAEDLKQDLSTVQEASVKELERTTPVGMAMVMMLV